MQCPNCHEDMHECRVCIKQGGEQGLNDNPVPVVCKNAEHPDHICKWVAIDNMAPPIERGAANDAKAKIDSMLNGNAVRNVENCPSFCPSCKVNSALSKLDMVMSRFAHDGLPPHSNDYQKEDKKFGGSDAHAIVSQALLRDHTRTHLTKFLDSNEKVLRSRSPCVFRNDDVWKDFKGPYIDCMVKTASEPADEKQIAEWLTDKRKSERRANLDQPLFRLKEWQNVWDNGGQTAPEKVEEERAPQARNKLAPTFEPPALEHELTEKQRESLDKFINRDLTAYATSFKVERRDETNVLFRMTTPLLTSTMTIQGDDTVEKRKLCNAKGTTITYEQQETVSGMTHPAENLMVAKERLVKDAWVGRMFSNIMGSPFTKGTQCRYCEQLQRDESVIQRYEYWKKHPDKTPEEYVGKGLIEEIESLNQGNAQGYVAKWMEEVAVELRKRILQDCKLEEADSAPSDLGPKSAEGAQALGANSYSEDEMENAIGEAVEQATKEKKAFTTNGLIGTARVKLTGQDKTINSGALSQLVTTKLAHMVNEGRLTLVKNKYSFTQS